jgi:hypothetical protein
MEEDEKLGFSPCGVGPLFLGPPGLDCSFLFRTAGEGPPGLDCSFLFRTAERETEPKRKAAGLIPEAKIESFFLKRANALRFAPVGRCSFLHGKIIRFSSRLWKEAGT